MKEEPLTEIPKKWGKEIIIVNNDQYSGKILCVDVGAESSIHMHKNKKETFFCLEGTIGLDIEGKGYMLTPFTRPKTIEPGQYHCLHGLTKAKIIEFATHDDLSDTYRRTESKEGFKEEG